jgi:hypothetical protein
MSDADLDLIIAAIGTLDEGDRQPYDQVLDRGLERIEDRRER